MPSVRRPVNLAAEYPVVLLSLSGLPSLHSSSLLSTDRESSSSARLCLTLEQRSDLGRPSFAYRSTPLWIVGGPPSAV